MAKIAAATVLYGAVHSLFASRTAKQTARRVLGARVRNGVYRPFYIGQSVATFAMLAWYARRLPDVQLYRVRGTARLLMHAGQIAGLAWAVWAAREVGVSRMLGIASARALARGEHFVPPEPESQGPSVREGELQVRGPFLYSRHPLNLAPLPVYWLMPRMTANLLAFNLVMTAYLVLGSKHEEVRLRDRYGEVYGGYMRGEVPFYVPSARAAGSERALRAA